MTYKRGCLGFILLIAVALSWACAWYFGLLATHIDDLQFVSLEPVHFVNSRDNMRLTFWSALNLRKEAEESGAFGLYAVLSVCPFHRNPWVGIGRVRHNNVDLDTKQVQGCLWTKKRGFEKCTVDFDTPLVRAEVEGVNRPGPYLYDVYFLYDGKQLLDENHLSAARSLQIPGGAADLCMRIDDQGPPGLISNVVRIPKVSLLRALSLAAHAPPRVTP